MVSSPTPVAESRRQRRKRRRRRSRPPATARGYRWLLPWGLAALGGLLAILAFPGVGWHPLVWISLAPLLVALEGTEPKRALALGTLAGFVANVGGFHWLTITVQEFGGLPLPVAILAMLLHCAWNGLAWGVFAAILRWIASDPEADDPYASEPRWWVPAVVFTTIEFVWWSVFPAYLGAAFRGLPLLMQGAEITGVLGCSFLSMLTVGAAWSWSRIRRGLPSDGGRPVAVIAGLALAAWIGFGAVRMAMIDRLSADARPLKIGLVQSNIGGIDKRGIGEEGLRIHQRMTRRLEDAGVDLVVWPESSYPYTYPLELEDAWRAIGPMKAPIVFGAVTEDRHGLGRNSALGVDREGRLAGASHKIHMVPFGEYLPFGSIFPALYDWIPAIGRLTPGERPLPIALDGLRIGTLVCYEDILPAFTRDVVRATDPDLLVNVTNDSWYGKTSNEPTIHLALAQFRAVEHRRSLVRSTNTGISALVDPVGRVVAATGQWTEETLVGSLPLLKGGRTIYGLFGDWIGWLSLAATLGWLVRGWRRDRAAESTA